MHKYLPVFFVTLLQLLNTSSMAESGTIGISGTTGTGGFAGTMSTTGTGGFAGTMSTTGTGGFTGTVGLTGTTGSTGTSGSAGIVGLTGTTGSTGTSGSAGIVGLTGTTGSLGTSGSAGASGTVGLTGSTGTTGFTVQISPTPTHGTVNSNPTGINCGSGGSSCTSSFGVSTNVQLTANPDVGYEFSNWTGDCSGSLPCTLNLITPTSNPIKTVSAQFQLLKKLTVSSSGLGSVSASPTGVVLSASGNTVWYGYGQNVSVTLTASSSPNAIFSGWGGTAGCTGTLPTCTVIMDTDKTVTATFLSYTLSLSTSPFSGYGTLSAAPAGTPVTSTQIKYAPGTVVTVSPNEVPTSLFKNWSGACSGTGSCQVTMNSNLSVTGVFVSALQLNLASDPTGTGSGTLTPSPAGPSCGSNCYKYLANTSVTVTQAASPGSIFSAWTSTCSGTGTCSVVMSANKTVQAKFILNNHTLSVTKTGGGSGTVSSSPSGISCGSTCSASFSHGSTITLTATPAAGSLFSNWVSGCSSISGNQCTVTLNANTTVQAAFVTATLDLKEAPGSATFTDGPITVKKGTNVSFKWTKSSNVTACSYQVNGGASPSPALTNPPSGTSTGTQVTQFGSSGKREVKLNCSVSSAGVTFPISDSVWINVLDPVITANGATGDVGPIAANDPVRLKWDGQGGATTGTLNCSISFTSSTAGPKILKLTSTNYFFDTALTSSFTGPSGQKTITHTASVTNLPFTLSCNVTGSPGTVTTLSRISFVASDSCTLSACSGGKCSYQNIDTTELDAFAAFNSVNANAWSENPTVIDDVSKGFGSLVTVDIYPSPTDILTELKNRMTPTQRAFHAFIVKMQKEPGAWIRESVITGMLSSDDDLANNDRPFQLYQAPVSWQANQLDRFMHNGEGTTGDGRKYIKFDSTQIVANAQAVYILEIKGKRFYLMHHPYESQRQGEPVYYIYQVLPLYYLQTNATDASVPDRSWGQLKAQLQSRHAILANGQELKQFEHFISNYPFLGSSDMIFHKGQILKGSSKLFLETATLGSFLPAWGVATNAERIIKVVSLTSTCGASAWHVGEKVYRLSSTGEWTAWDAADVALNSAFIVLAPYEDVSGILNTLKTRKMLARSEYCIQKCMGQPPYPGTEGAMGTGCRAAHTQFSGSTPVTWEQKVSSLNYADCAGGYARRTGTTPIGVYKELSSAERANHQDSINKLATLVSSIESGNGQAQLDTLLSAMSNEGRTNWGNVLKKWGDLEVDIQGFPGADPDYSLPYLFKEADIVAARNAGVLKFNNDTTANLTNGRTVSDYIQSQMSYLFPKGEDALPRWYYNGGRSYLHKYLVETVGGTTRELNWSSGLAGEQDFIKVFVKDSAEELAHGAAYHRVSGGWLLKTGMTDYRGMPLASEYYMPLTTELNEFVSWMKNQSATTLESIAVRTGDTYASSQDIQSKLWNQLCEADWAIFARNNGSKLNYDRMYGNPDTYEIRRVLQYWYKNIKGTPY